MVEILVYLTQNPVFAQDARMTLAGWDLVSAVEVAANPATPPEVLGYLWSQSNRRPALMPHLIENPAISESLLMELAGEAPREIVNMLLASPRARSSPGIVEALTTNSRLTPEELRDLRGEPEPIPEVAPQAAATTGGEADAAPMDPETEAAHKLFTEQHAGDIAAEAGKPFEMAAVEEDSATETLEGAAEQAGAQEQPADVAAIAEMVSEVAQGGSGTASSGTAGSSDLASKLAAAALGAHASDQPLRGVEEKKLTLLQRIARMNVADRVKTAFNGSREERSVLIRDMTKVVQNAVLSSPKLSDPEVESFASAKNLHENVFREIVRNRRFMKNYAVQRNLVGNPKTPLDISLSLIKNLMVYDLKALQRNKNVSETIRKLAQKLYQEKATSGGKTKS
jgi:hypothetical protein